MKVEYSSNNSGGYWWLDDNQWKALESAGWVVNWRPRSLGAIATSATRNGLSLNDAIREFESITGEASGAAGCSCCGNPHSFTEYDDNWKWVSSGPEVEYEDEDY